MNKKIMILFTASFLLMGSYVEKSKSLEFSGQRYFKIVDTSGRFDKVQERFNSLCLKYGVKSSDITANKVNGNWCVVVGDKVLVTVTVADSKLHKTPCEKLAKSWAKNVANHIESVTPLN